MASYKFIKISVNTLDCKGIYFKDTGNIFQGKKELNKKDLEKINYNNNTFEIRLYPTRGGIKKKSFSTSDITRLNAVKNTIAKRNELKEELQNTGTIKKQTFKSLDDIFQTYLQSKENTLSKENIYSMTKTYNKWIYKPLGKLNINIITTIDIQNIVNKMLKQGLAPRTSQTIKQILRPVFNYAIDLEICIKNPALKVNIPKFDNTKNFNLEDEQRLKLLDEILKYEYPQYKGIMLFLYLGRRLNEVLTLKWDKIKLNQDLDTYIIDAKYSKNRKIQIFPLSPILKDYLIEFGMLKNGFIFKGIKTEYIVRSTFISHWKKVVLRANIDKMGIHDTRHLLGNTLINRGISEDIIGKVLGHQSFSITSRYATVNINSVNEALNIYLEN